MKRLALVLITVLMLGASVRDRFNDAILDPMWDKQRRGDLNIALNQGLNAAEIRTNEGNTNAVSSAVLVARDLNIDWRRDFEINLDYRFPAIPSVPSGRSIMLGVALSFDGRFRFDRFNGVTVGVQKVGSRLFLVWRQYEEGDIVRSSRKRVLDPVDEIELEWDQSDGELKIKAANRTIRINNLEDDFEDEMGAGPLSVAIGGITDGGDISDAFGTLGSIDDFKFLGRTQ